jgi:hypothetical protein
MTMTPSWLYYLCAVLTLAVAAYCLISLIVKVCTRRGSGWDIDIAHTFMGVSMAGMSVARWAFGATVMWEIIFAVLLTWFLARTLQSVRHHGVHLSHFLVHAAMSLAMLLMYRFPVRVRGGSPTGPMSLSSAASRLDPGLAFVLVLIFFASAILTLDSSARGASHHTPRGSTPATSASGGPGSPPIRLERRCGRAGGVRGLADAPRLEDASHVLLCVLMGFLLIVMI